MDRHKNLFSISNTDTLTLIMFMLQIMNRRKEQYLDTLTAHNYDKESSLLLLEFESVAFSFIVIMLQAISSP